MSERLLSHSSERPPEFRTSGQSEPFNAQGDPDPIQTTDAPQNPLQSRAPAPQEQTQDVIVRAFSPVISICASDDTEELLLRKGVYGGLSALLGAFGEHIPGHVTVRHSKGSSKSFGDFGVRFVPLLSPIGSRRLAGPDQNGSMTGLGAQLSTDNPVSETSLESIDEALRLHLLDLQGEYLENKETEEATKLFNDGYFSESFSYLLRKLLAHGLSSSEYLFSQPVACLIAVSSQNAVPIEALRELYENSAQKSDRGPGRGESEILRYYVLVHDEDHDEIGKSMALFNLMKRHFGLHCHLLRIRGKSCNHNEPEGRLPQTSEWLTAEQELHARRLKGQ